MTRRSKWQICSLWTKNACELLQTIGLLIPLKTARLKGAQRCRVYMIREAYYVYINEWSVYRPSFRFSRFSSAFSPVPASSSADVIHASLLISISSVRSRTSRAGDCVFSGSTGHRPSQYQRGLMFSWISGFNVTRGFMHTGLLAYGI